MFKRITAYVNKWGRRMRVFEGRSELLVIYRYLSSENSRHMKRTTTTTTNTNLPKRKKQRFKLMSERYQRMPNFPIRMAYAEAVRHSVTAPLVCLSSFDENTYNRQ